MLDIHCLSLSSELSKEKREDVTSAFQMQSRRLRKEGVGLGLEPRPLTPDHFMLFSPYLPKLSRAYLCPTPHMQGPGNLPLKSLLPSLTVPHSNCHEVRSAPCQNHLLSNLTSPATHCPPRGQNNIKRKTDHILPNAWKHLKCFLI